MKNNKKITYFCFGISAGACITYLGNKGISAYPILVLCGIGLMILVDFFMIERESK